MERQRRPEVMPAHLYDVSRPEHSAWKGFFQGLSQAAKRENVSLQDFQSFTTFPYQEENELSLLSVLTYGYGENPLDYIHTQAVKIWRGRRWAATVAATGIFLDKDLHLTNTVYVPNMDSGLDLDNIYNLLHHIGGYLEQPQEYYVLPRNDQGNLLNFLF